jgi:ATP-dependent DNA helicase RecG
MEQNVTEGLATPIRFLKGVGEKRAELLAKLDIFTVGDLLLTLPRRYEDRRHLSPIARLESGAFATVGGSVVSCAWIQPRFGKGYFDAVLTDGAGFVRCRWFSARWMEDQLRPGDRLIAFGKVARRKGDVILQHPDYEIIRDDEEDPASRDSLHMGRVVPIYGLTESLPQRVLRRIAWNAVQRFAPLAEEVLPGETLRRWNLTGIREALVSAHFPDSVPDAERARRRLAFEEFLGMQLVLVARKIRTERWVTGMAHKAEGHLMRRFLESLPFALTGAQLRAIDAIRADMEKPRPMHRLLQGDVGSGKTVVAACALLNAIECGAQGAVMAPTEILAAQHFKTFTGYLSPMGLSVKLLVGSMSESDKVGARAAIADGRTHLVVGTHALIQDRVMFKRLGLIVIDEQHKFGVEQRGLLYGKGEHPDVLVMTATPIPRTLAMTLYGDLDVTEIDEMPAGRQAIVTRVIREAQLPKAYDFIRQQAAKGRQAYIVYPLVAESDLVDLKSAEAMFEELNGGPLCGLRLGLLHGQMPADAKESVMQQFRAGRLDVLVATTVVEVGVDVPNATIMLVENAEQFGLAQLHQLRGRIGRGAHRSFCILESSGGGLDAWKRLKIMEETTNGFRIAEEDFRIRGMGNLLGREQSGLPMLRVGDPLMDERILREARQEAFTLVESDPSFEKAEYEPLRRHARALYKSVEPFVKVG